MNAHQNAGVELSIRIGQRVRHQDYQGQRVTGVVHGLSVEDRALMADIVLDTPIVIPASGDSHPIRIHRQYVPAHELAPFDEREELIAEMLAALQGVVAVADRATDEFDRARAVIAKAIGGAS